jgi:4-hydroxyphenylpyruvate dioxygenase-like putative hemolysin
MSMKFSDGSIAYVELYVADAVPALETFTGAFAFTARALAEHPDRYSVLLSRGSARLIVTEPRGGGAVAEWLAAHGDGVRDIALYRPDVGRVTVDGVGAVQHTLLQTQADPHLPPGFCWQPLRSITQPLPIR